MNTYLCILTILLSFSSISQSKLRTNTSVKFNKKDLRERLNDKMNSRPVRLKDPKINQRLKSRLKGELGYDKAYADYYQLQSDVLLPDSALSLQDSALDSANFHSRSFRAVPFDKIKEKYDLPEDIDSLEFDRIIQSYYWDVPGYEMDSVTLQKYKLSDPTMHKSIEQNFEASLLDRLGDNEQFKLAKQQETELLSNFRNKQFLKKHTEYFSLEQLQKADIKQLKKVKKKEERVMFFKELVNQKSFAFDSTSTLQRFDGGGFLEIHNNFRNLDLSPFIEYNLTTKWLIGFGVNMKWKTHPIRLENTNYRYYSEYRIRQWFLHGEAVTSRTSTNEAIASNKKINYLVGAGRYFHIKKRVAGRIMLLMNLTDNEQQKSTLRYGFNLF